MFIHLHLCFELCRALHIHWNESKCENLLNDIYIFQSQWKRTLENLIICIIDRRTTSDFEGMLIFETCLLLWFNYDDEKALERLKASYKPLFLKPCQTNKSHPNNYLFKGFLMIDTFRPKLQCIQWPVVREEMRHWTLVNGFDVTMATCAETCRWIYPLQTALPMSPSPLYRLCMFIMLEL